MRPTLRPCRTCGNTFLARRDEPGATRCPECRPTPPPPSVPDVVQYMDSQRTRKRYDV